MHIDDDQLKEFCGIMGIYGSPEASIWAYLGLYSLQHRGQESAGIASSDGEVVRKHLGMGLVSDVFNEQILNDLRGHIAIGHNRYSTTGSSNEANIGPIVVNHRLGPIGVAHNGNLVNSFTLREMLEERGSIFQTTTDSEVILHLVAKSKKTTIEEKVKDACNQIEGAFSLIFITRDKIIAVRDRNGFRPLAIGKKGNSYIFASETSAFDLIGATYVRDVNCAEMLVVDENGMTSHHYTKKAKPRHCVFEFIYFSRPDSQIFNEYVDKTRRKLGKNLALENPCDADIVISVPDSSNTAALGYAARSDAKFEIGLIRNHYVGRTFIHPKQRSRDLNVRIKFNTVGGVVKDRRIIIVDDSIVRGTTLRALVKRLRDAGAKEVHVRVSSPPIRYPCFYGMDFPTKEELIANKKEIDEIAAYLGADSLKYLSLEAMLNAMPKDNGQEYCTACFSGEYPVVVEEKQFKERNER
ncbi:MAG: amidophosphoribosyltransferase [Calditrichales bacterium]|nr:MAG: amidophosphoribosyltransferase [Calditrichales bacterium]